ncbi:hypothetical protein [Tuwongella immobilis]|uniref:Nitrate reductase n=1 Tax=Tuwongella immobilis TaxID=692036 RepID=A0A6C2YRV7_9BACT|nr:hypothetical protein [Tuwongella immobilis]VIP04091.1 Uncharacterized protein OS=Cyanothece sp. (strain PCC 7425 / ATCC 29141) GN=Cyan7425_1910 PE=4 SV=1 [Tuwongella immobilis]VTS05549.1 Uncharacterized protein OS=Cyanothece sp. (strain PCC 7425 / ATCC 29141) GN=Cyan7425_1910 PE=4 SV=1 [Tuwongella immobilis]
MNLFSQNRSRKDPERVLQIKEWTRELLGLEESTVILVSELRCQEDDCPDVETVIAVMLAAGNQRVIKVFQPMDEVTREQIAARLRE